MLYFNINPDKEINGKIVFQKGVGGIACIGESDKESFIKENPNAEEISEKEYEDLKSIYKAFS